MEASVSALRARHAELEQAEQDAAHRAKVARITAERDALAAEIAATYPAIVGQLTSLVMRVRKMDAICESAGIAGSVEAQARGIPENFYINGGPVMRLIDAKVPMPDSGWCAWEQQFDASIVWHGAALIPAGERA